MWSFTQCIVFRELLEKPRMKQTVKVAGAKHTGTVVQELLRSLVLPDLPSSLSENAVEDQSDT